MLLSFPERGSESGGSWEVGAAQINFKQSFVDEPYLAHRRKVHSLNGSESYNHYLGRESAYFRLNGKGLLSGDLYL